MTDVVSIAGLPATAQEAADRFYIKHGPCCAGCDWWRHLNSSAGECLRSAPTSGEQRHGMLGMVNASLAVEAGHAITLRSHHCGDFKDEFDWTSLPPPYLRRIGWEPPASSALASGATTVNPASKASEPGEQTSAVSSPAAAPAVLQTADGVMVGHAPLADGFDGSTVRPGPNHSTIEIWYDTQAQARAAHEIIRDLIDAAHTSGVPPSDGGQSNG